MGKYFWFCFLLFGIWSTKKLKRALKYNLEGLNVFCVGDGIATSVLIRV